MKITIKLFATLRKGRFKSGEFEYPEGITVGEVLDKLGISRQEMEIGIIFINGKHAKFDAIIAPGDEVAIFPPVAGG